MLPLILFWIGVALGFAIGLQIASPSETTREQHKNGAVAVPFIFLFAAAVAKYLGM